MGNMLDEEVFPVPPMSMRVLERLGEEILNLLCPGALESPRPIDVIALVDDVLLQHGVDVTPVSAAELGNREAATDIDPDTGRTNILLLETFWYDLRAGGAKAYRARATVIHEVAHALLHVRYIKKWKAQPRAELLLNRVRRSQLRPFEDPEWQAWALAGCILAPRRTLMQLGDCSPRALSETYEISQPMVRSHLQRLGLKR